MLEHPTLACRTHGPESEYPVAPRPVITGMHNQRPESIANAKPDRSTFRRNHVIASCPLILNL
eukprot:9186612-Alexandrium_andersonii.AAC.1